MEPTSQVQNTTLTYIISTFASKHFTIYFICKFSSSLKKLQNQPQLLILSFKICVSLNFSIFFSNPSNYEQIEVEMHFEVGLLKSVPVNSK